MAADVSAHIEGLGDLRAALSGLPDKIKRKALTKALRAAGRVVQIAARQAAPVLQQPAPYRTRGLVKRKISVRVSKFAKQSGDVGVFIGVKPAKGAVYRKGALVRASARGARSAEDPYYWRFLEFGTRKMAARPFLSAGANVLDQARDVFMREAIPEINRLDQP